MSNADYKAYLQIVLSSSYYSTLPVLVDGGQTTIMASPANLNMSPPLLLIADTNSSIYLLIANAISSAPSGPIFDNLSVKFVNPDMSANMTTDLKLYLSGVVGCLDVK